MHSQPASGARTRAMAPKRDGPNWIMIAGGAIVMAVGIVIGRKQSPCQGEQSGSRRSSSIAKAEFSAPVDSKVSSSEGAPGSYSVVYDSDSPGMMELFDDNSSPEGTSSQLSWKAPRATTDWDDSGTPFASQPQFELDSSKSKRPPPAKRSQPASKQYRQFKNDPGCSDEFQSDSYSSPALRAGLAARREMVQQLRKRLRSRDATIFDLQAQVSDQDQAITMHRAHIADLHERLKTANTAFFKSNHEVQRLREELGIQSAKLSVNIDDRNGHDVLDIETKFVSPDLKAVNILEARMVSEKVKRLQGEKQEMESQVQAFSRECELLFRKASALETERVQLKRLLIEKGHLLEAKEDECRELTAALVSHQDNLDIETKDRESDWTRSSEVCRLSVALSGNSRPGTWTEGFDQPISCNTPDDCYSSSANIVDGDNRCNARELMRSYNTLFRQSPSRLDSDGSVSKPGSRAVPHGCTSKSSCDGSPNNYDGTDYDNDDSVSLSMVWSLQQEVYQLSDALAGRSKAVSQRKLETSRVLTEFQATQTSALCGPEELYDWEDLSQVLSFSPDGTSAEQLQDLSHKLETVAKQQQVEDEMEALRRHQDHIRTLKSRLAKLTAKCNAANIKSSDELSNDSVLHGVTRMVLDLADKLDVQEDQVRETAMDIQQLSMSLQLSSPYVPRSKKQGLQRMLQGGSRQADYPVFERIYHKDIPISPDQLPSVKPSYSTQEQKLDSRSSRSFDHQISFSSLPTKADARTPPSEDPPNKLYEFRVEAFDPLPSAKIRPKSGNLGAGKSSLRKPIGVHQSTGSGFKWDASYIENSSRVCFSPEEVTSGFSFRPLPTQAAGNPGNGGSGHSRCVVNSDDFQWTQEAQDLGPDPETGTGVGTPYAGHTYNFSQTNSTSHSQPAPPHELFGGSYGVITPTSHGKKFSSAIGIGSRDSSESRDSLRRLLFKSESTSAHSRYSLYDHEDDNCEDTAVVALEKTCLTTTERKAGFVSGDGNNYEVQIKRLAEGEELCSSVLVTSSSNYSARTNVHDMHSAPGFVGVSPFAARMACVDVKRSTSSFTSSPQANEVGTKQGASFLQSEDQDEDEAEDSKSMIGKENMRSNELFYSGSRPFSRTVSSKNNTWEESRSMTARDLFRWNSFQDSQR